MGEQTKTRTRSTEDLLREIVDVVVSRVHPKRIILFGSRASGRARAYADFDLAVEGVAMDARTERLLKETLDEKAGIFTVDLVVLDKVEPEFREIVIQTGRVVYGG
ncbi:MAG: nucleotidyltransferase domain-containing protein [Nitrospirae bacterium]|nr:nucleotidyltransferase domain-containing protein [Nitrospirota bacterium]